MKTLIRLFAVLGSLVVLPACPRPLPPLAQHAIDCGKQEMRDRGLPLIPKANACLLGLNFASCLLALIDGVGITEDIVACVVRSSGSSFAASALANPNDGIAKQNAERARQFILNRGYQFSN